MPGKQRSEQRKVQRSRGQSLVEFALVLPMLLVLIVSAIEIGRLFFTKIVITNAAREGAYYYAVNPSRLTDAGELTTRAQQAAITEAANSGISAVTVSTPSIVDHTEYSSVSITVSTTVDNLLILGFAGNFLTISATNHAEFPLSSTVEMMIQ